MARGEDALLTACKAAVAPHRIPHDFRRTTVRNLERVGVPRSVAMKMVGDKTEARYRCYAIADESMLREGAAKLEALLEAQRGALRVVAQLRNDKVTAKSGGCRHQAERSTQGTLAQLRCRRWAILGACLLGRLQLPPQSIFLNCLSRLRRARRRSRSYSTTSHMRPHTNTATIQVPCLNSDGTLL